MELKLMAMVRGNVSVHLSDHSEIDMADKGNHTDATKIRHGVVPRRLCLMLIEAWDID